jgi:L-threonylcarbamoyladenylate synthase
MVPDMTRLLPSAVPGAIDQAVQALLSRQVVAFPTDTVYGVASLAFEVEAIEKLFAAKGRDAGKAIAVLVGSPEALAQVSSGLNASAQRLAERFWPGPLTLVVPRNPALPAVLAPAPPGALPTIGVRMPDHPVALEVLRRTGPLAVTSANLSGGPNPHTAQDVADQLGGRIALILDGGRAPGGLPSTVVDCTRLQPVILRPGPLTEEDILAALDRQGFS